MLGSWPRPSRVLLGHVGMRHSLTAEGLSLPAAGLESSLPHGATVMAERGSTEFCTDANGSGRCKSDIETASPRQTRAASCTYSRSRSGLDAAEGCCEPTLSSDVQPLCLATHPGRSHLLAAAFAACGRTPCSSRERGESSERGHRTWSSHCLVPGHDGWGRWGKVLARLTALLIKKLLYNLQGASAV